MFHGNILILILILTNLAKVYLEYNFVCVLISESKLGNEKTKNRSKGAKSTASQRVTNGPLTKFGVL